MAEVASITDHLPERENHVEEDNTHGSIEDILTAAALAESMKEEIFTLVGEEPLHQEQRTDAESEESEEEDVDIMTVEEIVVETKASDEITSVDHVNETPQTTPEELSTAETLAAIEMHIEELSADQEAGENKELVTEENPKEDRDGTLDLESLLSLSEASEYDIEESTHDIQIRLGQSINDALDGIAIENAEDDKELSALIATGDNLPSLQTESVGGNEVGEFVASQFAMFQDDSNSIDLGRKRKSLDPTTVLEIPAEQPNEQSPLKPQSQEFENVNSHSPTSNTNSSLQREDVQDPPYQIQHVWTSSANAQRESIHEKPVIRLHVEISQLHYSQF